MMTLPRYDMVWHTTKTVRTFDVTTKPEAMAPGPSAAVDTTAKVRSLDATARNNGVSSLMQQPDFLSRPRKGTEHLRMNDFDATTNHKDVRKAH